MVYEMSEEKTKGSEPSSHIFNDPVFWHHFQTQVQSGSWSCNFPANVLQDTNNKDSALYKDPTVFLNRRLGAQRWVRATNQWVTLILGACKELAHKQPGNHTRELRDLHMLDAFADYVDHLDYFHRVASVMASKGMPVKAFSQDSSQIHDIDKLDPVMMVGYSERFEDNVATSVWDLCVDRHTRVNPHHQAHCVWHDCCKDDENCTFCQDIRSKALREMVCDKVSRRLQKNLGGRMSPEMWDVELAYYSGLSQDWLDKAAEMMRDLKEDNPTSA